MPPLGQLDNFEGSVTVTAPTGGYAVGEIVQLSSGAFAVARQTIAAAATGLVHLLGEQPVWTKKVAATGKSLAVGQKVYRVSASKSASSSSTGNTLVGVCVKAAAATDTEALIIGTASLGPAAT
jgi:hypothetical protein